MKCNLLLFLCLLLCRQSFSAISGVVVDQDRIPVANAKVDVFGTSFQSITDNQGRFFIDSAATQNRSNKLTFQYDSPKVTGDILYFTVNNSQGKILISFFNLKGQCSFSAPFSPNASGHYSVGLRSIARNRLASGTYIVKIDVGFTTIFSKITIQNRIKESTQATILKMLNQSGNNLLKSQTATGQWLYLAITKSGYLSKQIPIDSSVQNVDTVAIFQVVPSGLADTGITTNDTFLLKNTKSPIYGMSIVADSGVVIGSVAILCKETPSSIDSLHPLTPLIQLLIRSQYS